MSKCAVIISGGTLEDHLVLEQIERLEDKIIIGVDSGMEFLYRHHILPDYMVGDFDSLSEEIVTYYKEQTQVPIREFNPVKDASDTEIAIELGISLDCERLCIFGATGTRLDHMWANVQALMIPLRKKVDAKIIDAHNRIRLIEGRTILPKSEAFGPYFSIFPLGGTVYDLSITGAKYPLQGYTLKADSSMCVSNEWKEEEVVIDFPEGTVVLMETKD